LKNNYFLSLKGNSPLTLFSKFAEEYINASIKYALDFAILSSVIKQEGRDASINYIDDVWNLTVR
jgi:hypothetical protein